MSDVSSILFSKNPLLNGTKRVSMTPAGQPVGDSVYCPALSADGRYLAANCDGHELLGDAVKASRNSVRLDRVKGEFEAVSTGATGVNDASMSSTISPDGMNVAYCIWQTRAGGRHRDVIVHDFATGQDDLCSAGTHEGRPLEAALSPALSWDGNVVVFQVESERLKPNPSSPGQDIVAFDRTTRETTPICVSSGGERANGMSTDPTISGDGRLVAFSSRATNLVPGDTNGQDDVFVHDRQLGTTIRVSVTSDGQQADGPSFAPAISADGRFVAFGTSAPNLGGPATVVCVHDLQTHQTETLSLPGLVTDIVQPRLSGDGRFVAFLAKPGSSSGDKNNVYVYDRSNGRSACVSLNNRGENADGYCHAPAISADGKVIAYSTDAVNLVDLPVKQYKDQMYVALNPLHDDVLEQEFERQQSAPQSAGTIERRDDFVIINGVKIPKNHLQGASFGFIEQTPDGYVRLFTPHRQSVSQ